VTRQQAGSVKLRVLTVGCVASRKADKTVGASQGHFSSDIGLLVLYTVH